LSSLHVSHNNLHIGKSLIDSSFESVFFVDNELVDFCLKSGVTTISKSCLKILAGVFDLLAEIIHISDEFINSLAYSSKSGCISFLECIVQLVKEFLESAPCCSELGLKSFSESVSDMINDGRKFSASGDQCLDELCAAGWEFAKEEFDGGDDLLLKLLIINSEAFLISLKTWSENLVDFSLNLTSINFAVNIRYCKVLWLLLMWSRMLVSWDVVSTFVTLFV
jgi:hypothetical protein